MISLLPNHYNPCYYLRTNTVSASNSTFLCTTPSLLLMEIYLFVVTIIGRFATLSCSTSCVWWQKPFSLFLQKQTLILCIRLCSVSLSLLSLFAHCDPFAGTTRHWVNDKIANFTLLLARSIWRERKLIWNITDFSKSPLAQLTLSSAAAGSQMAVNCFSLSVESLVVCLL